jgi:RuvA, C-terminal domain
MSRRRHSRSLSRALYALVVQIVDLLILSLHLAVVLMLALTRTIERYAVRTTTRSVPAPRRDVPQRSEKASVIAPAPINVAAGPTPEHTLYNALVGLGFHAPEVRRFVASVGPRASHEAMATLIKEGLRALSS